MFGRLVIAAIVLVAFASTRRHPIPKDRATWRALAMMALIGNVLPFFLITWGERSISSSLTSILNSTTPLFTAGIAAAVLKEENLSPQRAAGILLGFVGVAVIVGVDSSAGSLAGKVAVVVAAASYGVAFVYARRALAGGGSPVALSAGQLSVAAVIALPLAGWETATGSTRGGAVAAVAVIMLGLFGTGIAYILYYKLVSEVGPTSTSFVTYLIPVFGVALGWLVLDERLGWNALVGALLVICGIALAESASRRAGKAL